MTNETRPSVACNTGWSILNYHRGFDTIHITYVGSTYESLIHKIKNLKDNAKQKIAIENCVIEIASVPLTVLPHGAGRFPYVLQCPDFYILLSNPGSKLPCAQIQIKSDAFLKYGAEESCKIADLMASEFACYHESHVSRADLCHDFSTDFSMSNLTRMNCVSRAREMSLHFVGAHMSGFTIGMRGDVALRFYDKTREIKHSNKPHWQQVWKNGGWDGSCKVWRAEYQIKRKELASHGLLSWADVLSSQAKIWHHYSTKWFRVVLPNETDSNRDRWEVASWWVDLSMSYGNWPESKLERLPVEIKPVSESYKFRNGLSALIGHMASTQKLHMGQALEHFWENASTYHGGYEALRHYIDKKVREHSYRQSKLHSGRGIFMPNAESIARFYTPAHFDTLADIPF